MDKPLQFTVVIGVTASIAAYKSADVVSQLRKKGCAVHVVMSENAHRFITPLTLATLSGNPVISSLWEEEKVQGTTHIALADMADLVLVAPATAHVIGCLSNGLAPDALGSVLLATKAPILMAPAMNGKMFLHPATQANLERLKTWGVEFIGPDSGMLACGYEGIGRLMPVENIVSAVEKKLKGMKKANQK